MGLFFVSEFSVVVEPHLGLDSIHNEKQASFVQIVEVTPQSSCVYSGFFSKDLLCHQCDALTQRYDN